MYELNLKRKLCPEDIFDDGLEVARLRYARLCSLFSNRRFPSEITAELCPNSRGVMSVSSWGYVRSLKGKLSFPKEVTAVPQRGNDSFQGRERMETASV